MPTDKAADPVDEVLLGLALAVHALGEAIVALTERQAKARSDGEKRELAAALPQLRTDQRDAESRMAALAASRASFTPPTAASLEKLRKAVEELSTQTQSGRSAGVVMSAATALLSAVKGVAPTGGGSSGSAGAGGPGSLRS